jgi:hypothetical protein
MAGESAEVEVPAASSWSDAGMEEGEQGREDDPNTRREPAVRKMRVHADNVMPGQGQVA